MATWKPLLRSFMFCCSLGAASALSVSCGPPCPTAKAPNSEGKWAEALDAMEVLPLDPKAGISIKRDVRNIVVDTSAEELARAFEQVMGDSERHFGLIKVRRKAENRNKPFKAGERFQGNYSLKLASEQLPKFWRAIFNELYENSAVREAVCLLENSQMSDYGEITLLDLNPPRGQPYRMRYNYLGHKKEGTGSPIAGSSTFLVTPIVDMRELEAYGVSQAARITQIFEYQEQTAVFAAFFGAGGLKLHNHVVYSQAEQAAALLGAKIIESDIQPNPELRAAEASVALAAAPSLACSSFQAAY